MPENWFGVIELGVHAWTIAQLSPCPSRLVKIPLPELFFSPNQIFKVAENSKVKMFGAVALEQSMTDMQGAYGKPYPRKAS